MRRQLLAAAAALVLIVLVSSSSLVRAQSNSQKDAPAQEIAPDVPDAIAVPAGLEPVISLHAKGSQIYTCQAGADGKFGWTLKGPDAELSDRKEKVIGQHLADPTSKLPTWKLKDGSGARRRDGFGVHTLAAGECCEQHGQRATREGDHDSASPHARRQAR
jgi:Protein of unknown function (DUF3455)